MTDAEIAAELERRDLQVEYLAELADSLGIRLDDLLDADAFAAFEQAPHAQRRAAALRVLSRDDG